MTRDPTTDQTTDPTTASIEEANAERDRLRAEVDVVFEKGYDQAVREIRSHFARVGQREVAAEIEKIFVGKNRS